MAFVLSKEMLNRSLEIVDKALPRQSPVKATENIFLESSSNELTFTTTNVELQIKVRMPYQGGEPVKILLPAKISEIVRYLPGTDVQLEFNRDNFQISLSSGSAKYNLFGAAADDFPRVTELSPAGSEIITMAPGEFRQILKMIIFAASTEETRPAFNGVLFEFNEDRLNFIASDTYRLVVKRISDPDWNFTGKRCLVPAKALRELLKIVDHGEGDIKIFPSREEMIFKLDPVYFAARLLNEKYPDISSVIPERCSTRIILDRKEMEETIGRAALLAEGPNHAVHLSVENGRLDVSVSSPVGRMDESVVIKQDGEEIALYINSRFVMDILKAAESAEMIIDFHGKNGPVIFRLPGDENYLYLVLPIKMD